MEKWTYRLLSDPSDFFWAAVVCLVERCLVCGDIARRYKKSKHVIQDWHARSLKFAAMVGLRVSNVPVAALKCVHGVLKSGPHCSESIETVPTNVCCCVENPTSMMEKQDYMQVNTVMHGPNACPASLHAVGLQPPHPQNHLLHVWCVLSQANHTLDIWFQLGAQAQMSHKKKRGFILEM